MKTAKAIPVLMYHHVSPNPGLVTVAPETFRTQMKQVAAAGYTTVTADAFLGFLQGRHQLPAKSVLVTFDDGYLDNYVHAFPVLREFGLKATIFAVTGWLADGPARPTMGEASPPACPDHRACMAAVANGQADEVMLRWSEIEAMEASGLVEIHSHTHSHTRRDQIIPEAAARRAALAQDLAKSREVLRQRLGRATQHLCWPQGYFDDDYIAVAKEQGFHALYTTRRHVNTRHTSPLAIGRVVTKERTDHWLRTRLAIYSSPLLGSLYRAVRGDK